MFGKKSEQFPSAAEPVETTPASGKNSEVVEHGQPEKIAERVARLHFLAAQHTHAREREIAELRATQ